MDVIRSSTRTREIPGGSPANVALGLGRLGRNVDLLTCIGEDERGDTIAEHLVDAGVNVLPESRFYGPTSTAIVDLASDGSAQYSFDIVWRLPEAYRPGSYDVLHVGSIGAFLSPGAVVVRRIMSLVQARHITFDPNVRPALIGPHGEALTAFERTASLSTVVKLSEEDAQWLYPGSHLTEVLARIRALGVPLVAMTRGSSGALLQAGDEVISIPAVSTRVIDTIGAGDTFMAALIDSIMAQRGAFDRAWLRRAGQQATRAAAFTVSRSGANLPTRTELEKEPLPDI